MLNQETYREEQGNLEDWKGELEGRETTSLIRSYEGIRLQNSPRA